MTPADPAPVTFETRLGSLLKAVAGGHHDSARAQVKRMTLAELRQAGETMALADTLCSSEYRKRGGT